MTTLSILSACLMLHSEAVHSKSATHALVLETKIPLTEETMFIRNSLKKQFVTHKPSSKETFKLNATGFDHLPELTALAKGDDSIPKPGKVAKTITRKYWVEDRYEYHDIKPEGDIEKFWWGIHYTQERPFDRKVREAMGIKTLTHGFNTQFMSGNILKYSDMGIYGGIDWGMQFYGRSDDSIVSFNVVAEDKAFSRLKSSSMDFLGRIHVEYAKFPIVPYFNLSAGPRILMTNHQVRAMLASTQYESTSDRNVATDASMLAGWGIGARFKISPRVSIDFRYEQFYGNALDVVDLKMSAINGGKNNLIKNRITPDGSQFKFGLIFDLSSSENEGVLVEPGHYETSEETIYVDPQDSNRVFIPCPCNQCDLKKEELNKQPQKESNGSGTNSNTPNPETPPSNSTPDRNQTSPRESTTPPPVKRKSQYPGVKTTPPAKP